MDLLYISRSSDVSPTLQTLAPHPVLHGLLPISGLLMDLPYISRSSAVRPTLPTLAPIQSSTSFSQYLDYWWIFYTSVDLLMLVPLSRHLPPSSPPRPSPNIWTIDGSSIHQPIFCCSSHSPDTSPPSSPPRPSPNIWTIDGSSIHQSIFRW